MKRKIFSVLFALVLVASFSLVTAVPVAAADPSTFTVTDGTYTTTPTGDEPFETGDISATLTGTWGDSAVIGGFTAAGTGGLYVVEEPTWGTTAGISVSGTLSELEIAFTGVAVWVEGDDITEDSVSGIVGTITIQPDGAFDAELTGDIAGGYHVDIDLDGLLWVAAAAIDLAVNDQNPWTDGAFTFENISPGGEPMPFDFKLHNVGGDPGILTFSMSYVENDMAGTPAPDMTADEFASLIYVEAVDYQFKWPADPEKQPGGYVGWVKDDLPQWLGMDLNEDGKVSLHEICQVGTIPYDVKGDPLQATAEITYFIEFQLGGSLEGGVAGGAILTDVESNSQGDGVSVTIVATLGTDIETSSGNVFRAAGVAGPVLNVDTDVSYGTIQDAIDDDDTLAGHTILVAPGTYNENVVVNKTLTLEGAQAGVNARGRTGPESIIDAQLADYGVFIIEATTTATLDGFTVRNYEVVGILAGAFSPPEDDPFVVHILNNVVEAPSPLVDAHNNNIQIGDGTTGTIIGNEVSGALLVDPNWSGSGILAAGSSNVLVSNNYVHGCEGGIQIVGYAEYRADRAAENNIIENNLVENCDAGISVQANSIGTIVRYNDVLNNDTGIGSLAYDLSWPEHSTPSGTEVRYNNIVGNVNYGVKSSVWWHHTGTVLAEEVDAKYNWWDDETGPDHATLNPGAQGDAVSENVVDFSPWLYDTQENFVSDAPCYAGSVVLGNEATAVEPDSYAGGWNSFSTPVTLDGSADYISELLALTAESDLSIVRAQRFDLASQEWVALVMGGELTGDDYQIKPGEGFFIQVEKKGSLPILCSTNPTSPPRTDLVAGWNLVGLSNFEMMDVGNALNNVDYSVVLSASPPNAETWSVPPADEEASMELGEAYWLGMGQPGILFGHTTTPVADDMTWELNQN